MAKIKSPAFQFYPADWLGSADIALMTPAEEGAYIRLLALSWLQDDCGLPDDDSAMAILSRLYDQWPASAAKIRAKFRSEGGRLYNDRLISERAKQRNYIETKSLGGKLGAERRWHSHNSPNGSPIGSVITHPMANDGSSSSSSKNKEVVSIPVAVGACGKPKDALTRSQKKTTRDGPISVAELVAQAGGIDAIVEGGYDHEF